MKTKRGCEFYYSQPLWVMVLKKKNLFLFSPNLRFEI